MSLVEIFQRRACVMRSVPVMVRRAYRSAMRVSLQEVMIGRVQNSEVRVSWGWEIAHPSPQDPPLSQRRGIFGLLVCRHVVF